MHYFEISPVTALPQMRHKSKEMKNRRTLEWLITLREINLLHSFTAVAKKPLSGKMNRENKYISMCRGGYPNTEITLNLTSTEMKDWNSFYVIVFKIRNTFGFESVLFSDTSLPEIIFCAC